MSAKRYSKGDGIKMDLAKTAVYYKKACNFGKDSHFINPSPKFKETRQTSYGAYEILK